MLPGFTFFPSTWSFLGRVMLHQVLATAHVSLQKVMRCPVVKNLTQTCSIKLSTHSRHQKACNLLAVLIVLRPVFGKQRITMGGQ